MKLPKIGNRSSSREKGKSLNTKNQSGSRATVKKLNDEMGPLLSKSSHIFQPNE